MKKSLITFVVVVCAMVVALFSYEDIRGKERQSHVNATYIAQGLATASRPKTPAADNSLLATGGFACSNDAVLYRSVFADEVENKIPRHRIVAIGPQRDTIYFFTEIIGAGGTRVTHQWFHDDIAVADVTFDIQADRWRTWSSKRLGNLGPGTLRVDVRDGDCLIGQESIKIVDRELKDPGSLSGWMRPRQAIEKMLAEQANEVASNAERQDHVDDLVEGGDTLLLAAIRIGDTSQALNLIRKGDYSVLKLQPDITKEDLARHMTMANPFLRDANGVSPIELAHDLGQSELVEALIESATMIDTRGQGRRGYKRRGRWDDAIMAIADELDWTRFEDSDTPLLRAARTGNERAVVILLQLATNPERSQNRAARALYAYDAGGRQAIDIARDSGFYGIERFLQLAMERSSPKWAVSRSTFSTEMAGDEPGDCRSAAFEGEAKLLFFAEITDMAGRRINHEWQFDGQVVQSNSFDVKSQRWTTQSGREFLPKDAGHWQVRVTTPRGEILHTAYLTYHALTPYIERNRENYNSGNCEMGGSALYEFIKAHAPLGKIQYLLDKGVVLEPDTRRGRDLLQLAISDGSITLTRWFLDRGFDIDGYFENLTTPLMSAAARGDEAMVLYLLKRGADIDKLQSYGGRNALQFAVGANRSGVVRILLESGAEPNTQDSRGVTPLNRAAHACDQETVRTLVEFGADPIVTDKQQKGPVYWAAQCVKSKAWPEGTAVFR